MELYIDPSFTRTGVLLVDGGEFLFRSFSSRIGDKNYINILNSARSISDQINSWLKVDFGKNCISVLCIESPAPVSRSSSMMSVLFMYLILSIKAHRIYLVHPSYINTKIFMRRSVLKSDILKYVRGLGVFPTNHDEASAYLLYVLHSKNYSVLWE